MLSDLFQNHLLLNKLAKPITLCMAAICFLQLLTVPVSAQFVNIDTTVIVDPASTTYQNQAAGEFTPGKGFLLVKNKFASLNLSIYAMARWVNQIPAEDTWLDHRDSLRTFDGRNDIYWHRTMVWLTGFVGTPKLTYMATIWTVTTTQQTLVYGNINYRFSNRLSAGIGIVPNTSIRSLQGPFPFYASTDRNMGEEALRGGFTNGIFITGELFPRFRYTAMLGNNLSILGVKAANLTRHFSKGISLSWFPTTGEFGPRGGFGDFESHEKMATRFGASYSHCRDNKFNNYDNPSPDNTQVRLSDGVLFFEPGALAPGLTAIEATYDQVSVDLGLKYKGFALHTELYYRTLQKIDAVNTEGAPAASPINFINDNGYMLEAFYMLVPKVLCVYGVNSMIIDEFKRNPYEIGGGVNIYPSKTRSWRINAQAMYIYKGAGGGTFGLYNSGQTGTTFTIGTDVLL